MTRVDHAVVDALIVSDDGKILLVQEGKPGREGLYNLPGGRIELHETVFEACVREVKEETGYVVELTGVVGFYQSVYPDLNVGGLVFSARVVGGKATVSAEHPEILWVNRQEFDELALTDKLFAKYAPTAVDHYFKYPSLPLGIVSATKY